MLKLFSFHLVELKINTLILIKLNVSNKFRASINNLLIIHIELNKDYIDTFGKLLEKIDIGIKISLLILEIKSSRLNINVR